MVVAIDYHAMRLQRFRIALIDFLRRWGIYLAITILLAGAGSNAPLTVAVALAAGLAGPLMVAADHGWWVVPAALAYAAAGALPVVATRPLWWPRGWAAAERALPIEVAVIRRSDRIFSWIVSAPWQAILLTGTIGLWMNGAMERDAWHAGTAAGAYAVGAFGSQALALLWMRGARHAAGSQRWAFRAARVGSSPRRAAGAAAFRTIGVRRALVFMPLIRGRATRSSAALVVGLVATGVCATARLWSDIPPGWSLAALAFVALAATSGLRPCTIRDLQPGWRAHRELPLDARSCERARIVLVLMPALVGIVVAVAVMVSSPDVAHLRVLAGYGLVLAVGCGFEAMTRETMQASNHAARWILILALAIAFGSEVSSS